MSTAPSKSWTSSSTIRAASDVEVGLGLVEQQHVGRLHEASGERHELALAAAERARGPVEVLLGEPEVAQVADGVAAGGVGPEALDEAAWRSSARAMQSRSATSAGSASCASTRGELLLEGGGLGRAAARTWRTVRSSSPTIWCR